MEKTKYLITDWGAIDKAVPIASRYQVGLEVQEFTNAINLDSPQEMPEEIIEKTRGLPWLSMHGPFYDLIPASRDVLIQQAVKQRFQQACEMAQKIGASHLILHSGYFPKTYPAEEWLRNSVNFWIDLLNQNPFEGEIHVENVYEDDPTNLRELIDRVNQAFQSIRLTICLDIGHVNANSSKSLEEWISKLGERIGYVHIHNNGGMLDDHWQLDQGTIQVEEVLNQLQRHSPGAVWTVETPISDIEPSLLWLQDRGFLTHSGD